jgi:hypothetical protein
LSLDATSAGGGSEHTRSTERIDRDGLVLPVVLATAAELAVHEAIMARIRSAA